MEAVEIYFGLDPDPRSKNWFLLGSPLPIFSVLAIYLYIIYKWGPRFIEKKKPYKLRNTLAIYNIVQVLACLHIIREIFTADNNIITFWQCNPKEISYSTNPMRLLNVSYFTLFVKLAELVETVFFVLRKKQNQVSQLHVIHHCCTVFLVWIVVRYAGGGAELFPIFLNSIIHVIMYLYYLLASLGPNMQEIITPYKKYITTMQMIQFVILLLQAGILKSKGCFSHWLITTTYAIMVMAIFYMFYNFYQDSYLKKQKNKMNQ